MSEDFDDFRVPVQERYFEDYRLGLVSFCGSEYVDEGELVEFGRRFDSQWIHTDPALAADGPFGRLITSGWHTASLTMRIFVTSYWNQDASLGGLGADDVRWLSPVRPGDTLSARFTVVEARRSKSKPDRGIIRVGIETYRDNGELVMTMKTTALARTRTAKDDY